MNDDLTELASAYLDDAVTADERAQVEASPELLAEVQRLRLVQGLLGSVEPPPISMREEQLAAALGAWDRLPDVERTAAVRDQTPAGVDTAAAAAASSVSAPRPSSAASRRRPRTRQWMLAAAAGLVTILAGGAILNSVFTEDEDEPASSDAAAEPEILADEPASEADDVAVEAAEEFESASTEAPADAPAAEPADDPRSEPDLEIAEAAEAPPPEDDVVLLGSGADLADFAANARLATTGQVVDQSDVPAETEAPAEDGGFDVPQCPDIEIVVGLAQYQDVPVVVGIDDESNEAVANAVADCSVIARAPLP